MRIVGDEIVTVYERLKGKLEVLPGWGFYQPRVGQRHGYRMRHVARRRFGHLSTWLRWNPKGEQRPTFEQFLLAYGLDFRPD